MQDLKVSRKLLNDKRLTLCDKLLIARLIALDGEIETNSETAYYLGLSDKSISASKSKLEKLHIIKNIGDNGRGKAYAVLEEF